MKLKVLLLSSSIKISSKSLILVRSHILLSHSGKESRFRYQKLNNTSSWAMSSPKKCLLRVLQFSLISEISVTKFAVIFFLWNLPKCPTVNWTAFLKKELSKRRHRGKKSKKSKFQNPILECF